MIGNPHQINTVKLKNILRKSGRSQLWLREQLIHRGIRRDKAHINLWCNDRRTPPDKYIAYAIAEILEVDKSEIINCFSQWRGKILPGEEWDFE